MLSNLNSCKFNSVSFHTVEFIESLGLECKFEFQNPAFALIFTLSLLSNVWRFHHKKLYTKPTVFHIPQRLASHQRQEFTLEKVQPRLCI